MKEHKKQYIQSILKPEGSSAEGVGFGTRTAAKKVVVRDVRDRREQGISMSLELFAKICFSNSGYNPAGLESDK